AVALLERGEGVAINALAVEMDRKDGFDGSPGRGMQDFLYSRGGEVEGVGLDVREKGRRSAAQNGADCGEEAERSGDDSVAGANAGSGHGQPDGVGTAGAANGMRRGTGLCGSLFEAIYLRTED